MEWKSPIRVRLFQAYEFSFECAIKLISANFMTQDHFLVYQFMASKFGGLSFDSLQELSKAVAAGSVTKLFVPIKAWAMYSIDCNEIFANCYIYGFV